MVVVREIRIRLFVVSFATLVTVILTTGGLANAESFYQALADSSQVIFNPSNTDATANASFVLNDAGTHLSYSIEFDGLDLEPIPENRTDPNDVIGMHLHLAVTDVTGPHILNIFGFPSEDDDDLVVDYEAETLSGIYDMSDASVDPDTGEVLPQFFPLTTKLIENWIDELDAGELYLAVHTVEASVNPPGVALRGQIVPVPEPTIPATVVILSLMCFRRSR